VNSERSFCGVHDPRLGRRQIVQLTARTGRGPRPLVRGERSTPRIQPPGSPYRAWVQHVLRAGDAHAARMARDPREVAIVIADALETRRPRFRYPVGPFARLNHFLRGKLPSRLLRRATMLYLGVSKVRQ
jgi:hypothetical protein